MSCRSKHLPQVCCISTGVIFKKGVLQESIPLCNIQCNNLTSKPNRSPRRRQGLLRVWTILVLTCGKMEGLVQQTVAEVAIPLLFFSLNTGIISPCQTFWLWLQIIGWKRAVATSELQKMLIKIILSTELLLMLFYTKRKNNKNPKTK